MLGIGSNAFHTPPRLKQRMSFALRTRPTDVCRPHLVLPRSYNLDVLVKGPVCYRGYLCTTGVRWFYITLTVMASGFPQRILGLFSSVEMHSQNYSSQDSLRKGNDYEAACSGDILSVLK